MFINNVDIAKIAKTVIVHEIYFSYYYDGAFLTPQLVCFKFTSLLMFVPFTAIGFSFLAFILVQS